MKNTTKGVIAGVAGLALLTGGATFAVWTDSVTLTGGTITNGSLDVEAVGTMSWKDVSDDRTDAGHTIDPATWRMVPGDTAQGTQAVTVTLVGDNLVANLGVDTTAATSTALPAGVVSATYRLLDGTTEVVGSTALGTDSTVRFATSTTSQGSPADTVILDSGGRKTLTVEVNVTFASTATAAMDATTVLDDVVVSLGQDRSGAGFTS